MRCFRKITLCLLSILLAFSLGGCTQSNQVENQAYALVLGIDLAQADQLKMTICIPKIAGESDSSDSGAGGGKEDAYMRISASADNYSAALEKLDWAIPRQLNLAQLKLLVVSRALAESKLFRDLLMNIAQTERLYTAAHVCICDEDAAGFVQALKPAIGSRLSTDIAATFEHYAELGLIPVSSLADVYELTHSIYSDPLCVYAQRSKSKGASEQAAAISGTPQEAANDIESEIETRYLGACVLYDGRLACTLDGSQTLYLNLLRGSLRQLRYHLGDTDLDLAPIGQPDIRVDCESQPVAVEVSLHLNINAHGSQADERALSDSLTNEILDMIETVQRAGVEPFGFAGIAARNFITLSDWQAYGWRERFAEAQVKIKLRFDRSEA